MITDKSGVWVLGENDFVKMLPLHKTLAFIDSEGFKLTEFTAIIEYFVALSTKHYFCDHTIKEKAQVARWLSFINQDMRDNIGIYLFFAKTEDDKLLVAAGLAEQFKYLDDELSTRKWWATDYITVADEYLFSWYCFCMTVLGDVNTEYPNFGRLHEAMKSQNEVAIALSKA